MTDAELMNLLRNLAQQQERYLQELARIRRMRFDLLHKPRSPSAGKVGPVVWAKWVLLNLDRGVHATKKEIRDWAERNIGWLPDLPNRDHIANLERTSWYKTLRRLTAIADQMGDKTSSAWRRIWDALDAMYPDEDDPPRPELLVDRKEMHRLGLEIEVLEICRNGYLRVRLHLPQERLEQISRRRVSADG